jgi:hypothetical protein
MLRSKSSWWHSNAAALACGLLAACGSSGDNGAGSGAQNDASSGSDVEGGANSDDSGVESGADGGCAPQTVDGGLPAFVPPRQPRSACTTSQIAAYYNACWTGNGTGQGCQNFEGDPANSACIDCVISRPGATTYGPIYYLADGTAQPNSSGCIALIDGDTSPTGCAAAYQALAVCQDLACASCPNIVTGGYAQYDACFKKSANSACKSEAQSALCARSTAKYAGCLFFDFQATFRGLAQVFCAASDAGTGNDAQSSQDGSSSGDH